MLAGRHRFSFWFVLHVAPPNWRNFEVLLPWHSPSGQSRLREAGNECREICARPRKKLAPCCREALTCWYSKNGKTFRHFSGHQTLFC